MGLAQYLTAPPAQAVEEKLVRQFGTPPPIARTFDDKPYYSEHYLQETGLWADEVYRASVTQIADDPEIRETSRYIDLLMGRWWPENRPGWKSKPVFNRMLKYMWDAVALLTDVRIAAGVHSENAALKPTAEILNKARQANWQNQDGDISLMMTAMHAMLGVGYMKVVSPNRDNDDVSFLPLGSDSVIPILGSNLDLQQSAGVIYRRWTPMSWFGERFPLRAAGIRPEASIDSQYFGLKPYGISEYSWSSISPGLKGWLQATTASQGEAGGSLRYGNLPISLYSEFWFKDPQLNLSKQTLRVGYGNFAYLSEPGAPIYPFGRLICTAQETNRVILWDGPNIHWHSLFPFAGLRLQPVPWMWSGISEFRALEPANSAINHIVADVLDLFAGVLNPTLIVAEGAISDTTWDNYFPGMPMAKLKVMAKGRNVTDLFHFVRPDAAGLAAFPPIIQILIQLFDQQSGMLDPSRLMAKKQIPAGDTIEQLRDTQQGPFRVKGRLMEAMMRQLGRLQIPDILQFYCMHKMISMFGTDGLTVEHFDYDPGNMIPADLNKEGEPFRRGREHARNFKAMVATGSSLPTQRRDNALFILALRKMHDVDRATVLEAARDAGIRLPATEVIEAHLKDETPMMLPRGKKAGGGIGGGLGAPK